MRIFMTCLTILFAANTLASEATDKLSKLHTGEYTEMKKVCEQWAADEGVAAEAKTAYVEKCIEDEIGYLLDDASSEEEGSSKE